MKLQISSYNNTGVTWNAEAEETSFLNYKLRHRFNHPAEAVCVIADTNGTKAQKYNVDADDVYIGPGKATIEHPDATDIFYGRILKAEADSINRTVTLYCRDWLDQLNEKRITYDMREKLTGNIRQSGAHTDPDNAKTYLRAPVVRTLYSAQADDGGAITDETTAANNVTTNDMTLMPAVPVVNDAYYFGFESKVAGMSLNISTQGNWAGSSLWDYYNGAAWASLGILEPTNTKWNFEVSGETSYGWTVPGDWATVAVNGVTAYYVRQRVATYSGITTQPKGAYAFAEYYLYDDDMSWAADTYNGMFVCFVHGDDTVSIWPYDETVTPTAAPMTDVFNTDIEDLWNDNANGHTLADTADYQVDYKLRPLVQVSSFYTSMSKAEITIKYYLTGTGSAVLSVYDYNGSTLRVLGDLPRTNGTIPEYKTYKIPAEYLPYFYDADGEANINIAVTVSAGTVTLKTFELRIDSTVVYAIGTNAVTISDTEANRLRVAEDITHEDGSWGIWEECKYSIAQYIYKHLDSAEVGTLIATYDTLVQLTHAATIEHTSGISLRQYVDRTPLEIIRDLCEIDKAVFWVTLGGTTVTYKSTFNNGAPTAMTDANVEGWRSVFDYESMTNEFDIYGMRKGDIEVYQNVSDATSIAKYAATRTQVIRNSGLMTQRDALALGTSLVGRDANIQQMLYASIAGLDSTYRLGTEVAITSTYLGLTAANYIVSEWTYDSENHKTMLVLHPRVSQQGLMSTNDIRDQFASVKSDAGTARKEQYIPEPITNEVA